MKGLVITNVRVRPYEHQDERLKAFATVTFNGCFLVSDLKVIQGPEGLFVAMPSRRRRDGSFRDIAHPLNQECRDEIETRVLAVYDAELSRMREGAAKSAGDAGDSGDSEAAADFAEGDMDELAPME